eukprot:779189-Pyramimonas_sp.AAC.1
MSGITCVFRYREHCAVARVCQYPVEDAAPARRAAPWLDGPSAGHGANCIGAWGSTVALRAARGR